MVQLASSLLNSGKYYVDDHLRAKQVRVDFRARRGIISFSLLAIFCLLNALMILFVKDHCERLTQMLNVPVGFVTFMK